MIDPADVGHYAAALLALDDPAPHAGQRHVLAGPVNVNGRDIVDAVGEITGTMVGEVNYRDLSFLEYLGAAGLVEKRLPPSVAKSIAGLWTGDGSKEKSGNSQAVVELAEPKGTMQEALKKFLL